MHSSDDWLPKQTVDNVTTFGAGSNIFGFTKYFAFGTEEDNASAEMTGVSTSGLT